MLDDDPDVLVRRWLDAEADAADDEADAACRSLFTAAVPAGRAPLDFAKRTMAAVAEARERERVQRQRARRLTAAGSAVAATVALVFGGELLLAWAAGAALWSLDLLVAGLLGAAGGLGSGVDVWATVAGAGRAMAALAQDPAVTAGLLALQGVAIAALFGLQRLLGSDGEAFK